VCSFYTHFSISLETWRTAECEIIVIVHSVLVNVSKCLFISFNAHCLSCF